MVHILPSEAFDNCDGLFYCLAKWAYDVTNGFFWVAILIAFCIMLYIATQRLGNTRAFGFSAFVGLSASVFLSSAQLMPYWITSIFILVGAVGIIALVMNER